jgi:hypothetical protein
MSVEFWYDQTDLSSRPPVVDLFAFHPYPHKHFNEKYGKEMYCHEDQENSLLETFRNRYRKRIAYPLYSSLVITTRSLLEAFTSHNDTTHVEKKLQDIFNHATHFGLFKPEGQLEKYRYDQARFKELQRWWRYVSAEPNYFSESFAWKKPGADLLTFTHHKDGRLRILHGAHDVDVNTVYRNYRYANSFIETVDAILVNKTSSSVDEAVSYYDKYIQSVWDLIKNKTGKNPTRSDIIAVFSQGVVSGKFDEKAKTAIIESYLQSKPKGATKAL